MDCSDEITSLNSTLRFSIECEDDADHFTGIIVYGDETFPVRQDSSSGQGLYSSVQPFQVPGYVHEDTNSLPPDSLQEDEDEEDDEDEEK